MLSNIPKDYLEKFSDYVLHPTNINLNPDKIVYFTLGLGVGPEGNWHSTMYANVDNDKIKDYKEWCEIAWEIEENITFWIRILTYIGEDRKYIFPEKCSVDKIYLQIVDHNAAPGKFTYGWGKEYINKTVDSIDDVFTFIKDHHILSSFFFTEKEKENLKLNDYKDE